MEMSLRAVLGQTDHSEVLTKWAEGPQDAQAGGGALRKEGAKLQAVCQKAMPLIERKVADEEDLYMAVFCGIVQHSPTLAGAVRRVRAGPRARGGRDAAGALGVVRRGALESSSCSASGWQLRAELLQMM